jgi:polar amino acid transport system substrate-binding protein
MAVVLMMVAMFVAACGGSTASVSPSASADTSCAPESLALKTAGVLTLSTDNPAYSPWFQGGNEGTGPWGDATGDNNDPASGKGFESALAYAIADKLGFTADKIVWVVTPFNQSYAPGDKAFDLFINQVSITSERDMAVDFSEGYYEVKQAVVTKEGSTIAGATTIAELSASRIGVQIGTTSFIAVQDVIKPTTDISVFDTTDEAVAALEGGLIDALVADLPTAWVIQNFFLSDGIMLGEITNATTDQFGILLENGSPLKSCVDAAILELKQNGTLDKIFTEWIPADLASVPELK